MLSVWWDVKGIMHFKLLPKNQTIDSAVRYQQLVKLNNAIHQKPPELVSIMSVVFYYEKAKPHTSLVSHKKILDIGWDVLPYPHYTLNLAHSDYYLFRALPNFLNRKTFDSDEVINRHLVLSLLKTCHSTSVEL